MKKNPYSRLLEIAKEYSFSVRSPQTRNMWNYPKTRLSEGWSLSDLYERTKAADQLCYDVRLVATDEGLLVQYVKRPTTPWELK